jgi:hypothetical protein
LRANPGQARGHSSDLGAQARTRRFPVAHRITIHSPTTYSWFGRRSQPPPPRLRPLLQSGGAHLLLLAVLRLQLYRDLYCQGAAVPAHPVIESPPPPTSAPFVEALSAANAGRGPRQPGWRIREIRGQRVVVGRDGLRALARQEVLVVQDGADVTIGAMVDVRLPKEHREAAPGFYLALGDEYLDTNDGQPVVRFYWNLRSTGARRLVGVLTTRLNAEAVPFHLKLLNGAGQYRRCDAGVLYIPKQALGTVSRILPEIYRAVAPQLKPLTPALTKRLAPGLGVAEGPSSGGSFGLHRCGMLAEGVLRAHQQGYRRTAERLEVVATCFAEQGIDLDVPFLSPGSADEYAVLAS